MTEFHVEVVRVGPVTKHPNADRLEMTTVHNGYPVLFQKGAFKEGDLAVYVPIDAVVPPTEEWEFLRPAGALEWRDKDRRIRAKRLRGVFSMGLLTETPAGAKEGQDVAQKLGITKYEDDVEAPPAKKSAPRKLTLWQRILAFFGFPPPPVDGPLHRLRPPKLKHLPGYYDIEPFRKYGKSWFQNGEFVVVTEKIHGQNASFVHDGKQLHLKSRTRWRAYEPEDRQNVWAVVALKYKLEERLAAYPGMILYGETYGNNSDMPYGVDRALEGDRFVAFDVFDSNANRWLDWAEFNAFCIAIGIPRAPVLATMQWNESTYDNLLPLAEGKTTMAKASHVREGFVIKPIVNRYIHGGQRVMLKMHGEGFLTRKS